MLEPITDPGVLEGYLVDASNVRGQAECLFRPRTDAEVAEVVAWCQARGLPLTVTVGDQTISTVWASRFGDVPEGEPLCYIDSAGRLALAVNRGSAAATYGAGRRTTITIKRG